jgi:hypothetical protein
MQPIGQLVKAGRTLLDLVRNRVELSSIIRRQTVCALAEPVDADLNKGQLLSYIVVQLSGDSGALFVLSTDQATGEFLNLSFRLLLKHQVRTIRRAGDIRNPASCSIRISK